MAVIDKYLLCYVDNSLLSLHLLLRRRLFLRENLLLQRGL